MSVKLEHESTLLGKFDDLVLIKNMPQKDNIIKSTGTDGQHNAAQRGAHPTNPLLMKSGNIGHVAGSMKYEYSWEAGDFTEAQVDEAVTIFEDNISDKATVDGIWNLTKDFANHKIILDVTQMENIVYSDWSEGHPQKYGFNTPHRKITCTNDQAYYLCYNVIGGNYVFWKYKENSIAPGESLTILKRDDRYNILIFTGDVTTTTSDNLIQTLDSWNAYDIQSDEIIVKNEGSSNVVVIMMHK